MFERIARRHPQRAEEPDASPPESAGASPHVPTPVTGADAGAPAGDAPTERIDVAAPAPAATAPAAVASPAPSTPTAPEQTVIVPAPRRPGFRARGRMRRRLRYLRKLRDLQVRDLGGLVFDLRRFGRARDDLLAQKIDQIRACDDELRALELVLDECRDLRDVREPGIGGTCPRCFALFGSADRFCASCGAALGGAVQGPAQVPLAAASAPAATPPSAAPPAPAPPAPAVPPAAPPEAAGDGRDGV